MSKTIFVSGASGATGSATVDQLREALAGYGMSEIVANATAELLGQVETGTAAYVSPDIQTLLGRAPCDFALWVQDNAHAFR